MKLDIADPAATGKLTVDTSASLEFDSNLTKLHNELRGTSIVVGNNITLNPAAASGRVEVEGEFYLRPSDLTDAADGYCCSLLLESLSDRSTVMVVN